MRHKPHNLGNVHEIATAKSDNFLACFGLKIIEY